MTHDKHVARAPTVATLAWLLLAAGCSNRADEQGTNPPGGGSPLPFIQIQSAIADGTTNVGQGPFPVSFYGAGRVLDSATMTALLARIQLKTWPEATAVASTSAVDPSSDMTQATAQVTATAPLENRWYALTFGPSEAGIVIQQTFDDDGRGVRLRPDSHPAVVVAEFCGTTGLQGMKFIVTFSEPVTVEQPAEALTVQQGGVALSCRLDAVGPAAVHQFCDGLTPGPATVSLAAGTVRGQDGAFLEGQLWTVDIATLPLVESGCNGYRVPLGG
jgi:hypothetical protein